MVHPCLAHLLVVLTVGVLGVYCAVQEETEFPGLLSVLGSKLAVAEDYYDGEEGEAHAPAAPCCFPLVWQGRSVHEFGFSSEGGRGHHSKPGLRLSSSVDHFYVDGQNQRLAGRKVEFHGHHCSVNVSWIFSITNSTGNYYLFDPASKKCEHRIVRNVAWRRQCIPRNATSRGNFSLGPVGGTTVQSWSFGGCSRRAAAIEGDNNPNPRPRVAFGASILVVPSTCVPVLMQEHGFIFRGIDQQDDDFASQVGIEDTGALNSDDSNYESYVRYAFMFYNHSFRYAN